MFHKRIMVYAYTRQNFGDDLFVKILCERYPDVKFWIYTMPSYKMTWSKIKNLRIFSNENLIAKSINQFGKFFKITNLYERLLAGQCNGCVYIGGSLFIQGDNWKNNFDYLNSRQIKGKPFYLLGTNFGPYQDKQFYTFHKRWFSTFEDVCFRDTFSYDIFKQLKNTRYAKDIVFNFRIPEKKQEKKSIVVSVISVEHRNQLCQFAKQYYEAIERICRFMSSKGYAIYLVSFCGLEGDIEAVESLMTCMEDVPGVYQKSYINDIDNIINLFQEAEFVIATRFHAMILGWILNKKVLPIIYSEKMQHVIEDLSYTGPTTFIKDIFNFDENNMFQIKRSSCYIDLKCAKNESQKQFLRLDDFLAK